METPYRITPVEDFELFLGDLIPKLEAATPGAWPVTKLTLDYIVPLTRSELELTLRRKPRTYYLIDASDRVAWEEDGIFGNHRSISVQLPKA
jgi:hypothetical protein